MSEEKSEYKAPVRASRRKDKDGWAKVVGWVGLALLLIGVMVTSTMTYELLRSAGLGPGSALAALLFYDASLLYWLWALVVSGRTTVLAITAGIGAGSAFILICLVTGLRVGGVSLTAFGPRTVGIVVESGIVVNMALHIVFVLGQPSIWRRLRRNRETARLFAAAMADFEDAEKFEQRKDELQDKLSGELMRELEGELLASAFFQGPGGEE